MDTEWKKRTVILTVRKTEWESEKDENNRYKLYIRYYEKILDTKRKNVSTRVGSKRSQANNRSHNASSNMQIDTTLRRRTKRDKKKHCSEKVMIRVMTAIDIQSCM